MHRFKHLAVRKATIRILGCMGNMLAIMSVSKSSSALS